MTPLQHPLRAAPWLLAAALAALPGLAQASFISYTNQGAFLAAVSGAGTDSYNNLAFGTTTPTPLARQAGSLSYSVAVDPDTSFTNANGPVAPGLAFGAGSVGDTWLSTNSSTDTLRLFGLGGVRAIGGRFFGSDVDGAFLASTTLLLQATDSAGTTSFTLSNPIANGFFGLISDANLVSLTVSALQPANGDAWLSVNDLVLANPVPEPGSLALVLAGLLGVAGAARQRRRMPA